MEKTLEIEFTNLFGGDGNLRYIQVEEQKLSRQKKSKISKESLPGVSMDNSTNEVKTEVKTQEVQTFQRDEKNIPIFRLGGVHGKMWGATRAAGKLLAELGHPEFKSKAGVDKYMTMINFEPQMVKLENIGKITETQVPQILNTMGNSMVIQRYDTIDKCTCKLKIQYPDAIEAKVLAMLEQSCKMATMNKRRATMRITNWKDVNK
jgi:hypothetical protein